MQILASPTVARGELMKICNRLVPALYQLYRGDATSIKQQRKHTQERVRVLLQGASYTKVSACLVL